MFRLLLLLGLGYLIYRLLVPAAPKKVSRGRETAAASRSAGGERMVKCETCGLYVPEHEAWRSGPGDRHCYCSRKCAGGRN